MPGAVIRSLAVVLLTVMVMSSFPNPAAALRCGVERWSVKTAADPDVSRIDLTKTTTTAITAMLQLSEPSSRPDNARVDPTETTIFSITARLARYKWENSDKSGDSDYHLVIEDENGESMVAEIPNPVCVAANSPLRARIEQARQQFDAMFQATGGFTPVDPPISVQITGVGFFDKPSHGSGSANNGIELHPVLGLIFNPGPGAPTTSTRQLLGNGGFEDGTPQPWTTSADVVTNLAGRRPHSGAYYAWLGGYGTTHTDTLSQSVTIPADAQKVTLAFWLSVATTETTSTDRYDEMNLEIQNSAGTILQGVVTYSNLDATAGYEKRTFILTRFKGQTIVLAFSASEDSSLETSWLLDDLTITVE